MKLTFTARQMTTYFHGNPIILIGILAYAQQATMDSIATLNAIEQRLTESIRVTNIDLLEENSKVRPTRVMVNLGGDILKWLLGTVSNTDLVDLHYRLQTNGQTNEEIDTRPSYHSLRKSSSH